MTVLYRRSTGALALAFAAFVGLTILTARPAAAQSSCSEWNSTCRARCNQTNGGASCAKYCAGQMAQCRQSGCWTQGQRFGGARHCNLRKS